MSDGNKIAVIKTAVERRAAAELAEAKAPEEIPSRFIRDCLDANELGDGHLFNRVNAGRFAYHEDTGGWLRWAGHHWEEDKAEAHVSAVEAVAEEYLKEMDRAFLELKEAEDPDKRLKKLPGELKDRVKRLRSRKGRNNTVELARTCTGAPRVRGEAIDTQPWLLPCPNGVLDLKTGELRPGRRDEWLVKACPTPWEGIDAPCPTWETTLTDIMAGDEAEALYHFIRRAFGFALIGRVVESKLFILTGQGRNGKSLVCKMIQKALGQDIARTSPPEILLDLGKSKNPDAPTSSIMALKGARLVFASETEDGGRISGGKAKGITGGDPLAGRNPHDKAQQVFDPSHTFFLMTNYVPRTPPDDFAFWERAVIVPFRRSFVDREPAAENERRADPNLEEKIIEELPGLLAWMVRGCLEYQQHGLQPPPIVTNATAAKRRADDIAGDWIEARCVQSPGIETTSKSLYTDFEAWWRANVSDNPWKPTKFGRVLTAKNFERGKDSKGNIVYKNIGLQYNL